MWFNIYIEIINYITLPLADHFVKNITTNLTQPNLTLPNLT